MKCVLLLGKYGRFEEDLGHVVYKRDDTIELDEATALKLIASGRVRAVTEQAAPVVPEVEVLVVPEEEAPPVVEKKRKLKARARR